MLIGNIICNNCYSSSRSSLYFLENEPYDNAHTIFAVNWWLHLAPLLGLVPKSRCGLLAKRQWQEMILFDTFLICQDSVQIDVPEIADTGWLQCYVNAASYDMEA